MALLSLVLICWRWWHEILLHLFFNYCLNVINAAIILDFITIITTHPTVLNAWNNEVFGVDRLIKATENRRFRFCWWGEMPTLVNQRAYSVVCLPCTLITSRVRPTSTHRLYWLVVEEAEFILWLVASLFDKYLAAGVLITVCRGIGLLLVRLLLHAAIIVVCICVIRLGGGCRPGSDLVVVVLELGNVDVFYVVVHFLKYFLHFAAKLLSISFVTALISVCRLATLCCLLVCYLCSLVSLLHFWSFLWPQFLNLNDLERSNL